MADNDDRERAEQLIREINSYIDQNNELSAELETAVHNVSILASNVDNMAVPVVRQINDLNGRTTVLEENVTTVKNALAELTRQYFLFKNLSTASKNLTQYTEEYYQRFRFYHKLRRITLGYVIGVDSAIINSETLRREVERIYLQNTEYWLAYAIMAVMLWCEDEKEAANRALRKALNKDVCRADVFFLLINLRFDRQDAAKDWYLDYLNKVDLSRLGSEYQYLLQAYLAGLFGSDPEFEEYVSECLQKNLASIDATTVDFSKRFSDRAKSYANTYLHVTEHEFPTLHEVSSDYDSLKHLLSRAEVNAEIAGLYNDLANQQEEYSENQAERIEKVLYDLINAYDDDEWKVIKNQKYNEAILEAKGDVTAARQKYALQYENLDKKRSLADYLMDWTFSEDPSITNLTIKRFTVSLMKEPIAQGFAQYAQDYQKLEPSTVHLEIDGCPIECSEDDYEAERNKLALHYTRNRMKDSFKDRYVQLFALVCAASVLLLIFTAFAFNPITLTIGVLGGIVGGFVLWRRLVEVGRILEERKRLGLLKLKQALEEFASWRKIYHQADRHTEDVQQALEQF